MKRRIRRITGLLMTALLTATLAGGCGSDSDSKETVSAAKDDKVLRVGMECAYAPFNWTQETAEVSNGSKAEPIYSTDFYAYGYDVAVAQKIAEQMGMELEVHKVDWSSIGTSLDSGDYDAIIAGMGKTKEREMSYAFTEPYYYRDNCIVVKKGGPYENVTKLSELAGKECKVTTQLGTGWVPLLSQIEGSVEAGNYETTSECFMAVSNGVADVCIVDLPTAESAALTNDDLKVITFDPADTFTGDDEMVNVCIATRKDDTEFRDKIQDAMDAIGWNDKAAMDKLMDEVLKVQPAAE